MAEIDSPMRVFQDRILRVPGVIFPEGTYNSGAYGIFEGKNPGRELKSFNGLLSFLSDTQRQLVRSIADQFTNQRRNEFMTISSDAPSGTIPHEAAHALLYRIGKQFRDTGRAKQLYKIPKLGQEEFAYGVSDPVNFESRKYLPVVDAVLGKLNRSNEYENFLADRLMQLRKVAMMAQKGATELEPLK